MFPPNMLSHRLRLLPVLLCIACRADGGAGRHSAPGAVTDSGFAALQKRGKAAMGVDQYTSAHRFDDLVDGGRIELQRDPTDTAGVRTIRDHLAGIARSFEAGDFQVPGLVHAGEVPGTEVMSARRQSIGYHFSPLPGGGEIRIQSADPSAVRAIHAFLAFQRADHRAAGAAHRQ